ncbi:MAG: HoxN/HupN/NixA family nickel/cobalt transporter [Betaproteobacteria bacterium]|nr:HoxN/HupN/NixA family nickel/cobalt transporter [Betaproteobacteria bacterium]MBU6511054.1 HoxN/HupN/NixA family nickel/cobalt transporter [Betaproteobacteria bacterium]MDE2151381.1 HoxN/HupN/NixA family nickel/cobalt transporter [Betaproteobacteria bacterium]MDE2479170.1 HoxN/HupN/NixA family nickel/cobalt transporter [Betaproteobacteria bacterium]
MPSSKPCTHSSPLPSAGERRALGGYAAAIAALHLLGWSLCLAQARAHPALLGLGVSAYLFGLRHAFDADHVAAVDDTVRLLLQKGRPPLGAGFFFSLGHSSVVFVLALLAAFGASLLQRHLPGLQSLGGWIGAVVSGVFLWIVGLLNLGVLLDLLRLWRRHRSGHGHAHPHMEALLARRGLLNRLFGRRLGAMVEHGWQMYPIGLLFGLGFDTASEIALLALTAGAAAGRAPLAAVLALPLLFTAGMSLVDTADGVMMARAYRWALLDPVRRMAYNLASTSLSVAVALGIGSAELLQVLAGHLGLHGAAAGLLAGLSLDRLGYAIVALFMLAWGASLLVWRHGLREAASPPPG